jgi:hypothetical protein
LCRDVCLQDEASVNSMNIHRSLIVDN